MAGGGLGIAHILGPIAAASIQLCKMEAEYEEPTLHVCAQHRGHLQPGWSRLTAPD